MTCKGQRHFCMFTLYIFVHLSVVTYMEFKWYFLIFYTQPIQDLGDVIHFWREIPKVNSTICSWFWVLKLHQSRQVRYSINPFCLPSCAISDEPKKSKSQILDGIEFLTEFYTGQWPNPIYNNSYENINLQTSTRRIFSSTFVDPSLIWVFYMTVYIIGLIS